MLSRGSQTAKKAPVGSWTSAIRPASITSNGSIATVPPLSAAARAASSALVTVTYEFQAGGWPSCCTADSAPTYLPPLSSIV